MNAKTFQQLLLSLQACPEAVRWCRGKSLAQAWRTSKRADWMLWLCGMMADKPDWPTRQQVVLAACACARTALKHVPPGEGRPLAAIETAERWAKGKATIGEAGDAAWAAWAAWAAGAAAGAAARAARAAAGAAGAAAWAAGAAGAAAWAASERKGLSSLATLVRKHLTVPGRRKA